MKSNRLLLHSRLPRTPAATMIRMMSADGMSNVLANIASNQQEAQAADASGWKADDVPHGTQPARGWSGCSVLPAAPPRAGRGCRRPHWALPYCSSLPPVADCTRDIQPSSNMSQFRSIGTRYSHTRPGVGWTPHLDHRKQHCNTQDQSENHPAPLLRSFDLLSTQQPPAVGTAAASSVQRQVSGIH